MHKEIEVRFLEINKEALLARLAELGAEDRGEDLLQEVIFYDKELVWRDTKTKFVRLRKDRHGITVCYKHQFDKTADGTEEIEFDISDINKAEVFLERVGLLACRHQEKKRHTFMFGDVTVDIDSWPKVPPYVELEGPSEDALKNAALALELDWSKVVYDNARLVLENYYHIPVGTMKYFTFNRFE